VQKLLAYAAWVREKMRPHTGGSTAGSSGEGMAKHFGFGRIVRLGVALLAAGVVTGVGLAARAAPPPRSGWDRTRDWFSQNFEVHGFARTLYYTRVPEWENTPEPSSLRTELNLEPQLKIWSNDDYDAKLSFYGVLRPVYEAVYDFNPNLYGRSLKHAAVGTGGAYPNNQNAFLSWDGEGFFGEGGRLDGEFTILNSDTGSFFEGRPVPAISIDPVVFFGRVTAPVTARGSHQSAVGGNADGTTYEDLRDNFGSVLGVPVFNNGGLPAGRGLDASLTAGAASAFAAAGLDTPLNYYFRGGIGDSGSLVDGSADINRREPELKYDCFDNAHPYCFAREFYLDFTWEDTFVRFGRQQIVWGKTDAFRLQDVINPIDLGYHNVFPSLEERRIPVLALDVIQSLGYIGPFQDVSLEFAWVWDRFIPDQFGQCGEPWAFTAACEARADAGGHGLFNFSLASVDQHKWTFGNTQPGVRLEWRIPEPSISFSLSFFYGFQKTPVAKFQNFYSVDNPNSAVMLFLQGLADPGFANAINPTGSVAATIDGLAALGSTTGGPFAYSSPGNIANAGNAAASTGIWLEGFDPYERAGSAAAGDLQLANQDLQNAFYALTNVVPVPNGCADAVGEQALAVCGGAISLFGLPWSASEAELKYPRVPTLGGSLDYQIPGIDTILRLEMAAEFSRGIQDTDQLDQVAHSDVFKAAIGLDRSTFIPFINPDRTAFISFQTFLEHIVDYNDGSLPNEGMVPYQTDVISTLFMENYWRNDSIVLTNLAAVDWQAQAVLWAPKIRYVYNQNLFFEFGFNMLWGQTRRHNIRDFCSDGTIDSPSAANGGCTFRNPATWQAGNWQDLNGPLQRASVSPYGWGQQSFADRFMRTRDEFWVGVTYQF
jgi:hypothetical protein